MKKKSLLVASLGQELEQSSVLVAEEPDVEYESLITK